MPQIKKQQNQIYNTTQNYHNSSANIQKKETPNQNGLLGNLKTDDIILLIVLYILFQDECDDKLLILALAFVFISDIL